jgi:hypothetical protein
MQQLLRTSQRLWETLFVISTFREACSRYREPMRAIVSKLHVDGRAHQRVVLYPVAIPGPSVTKNPPQITPSVVGQAELLIAVVLP